MRGMRKSRSGFTLIELLVVVGVISILTAMLMPSLKRAREQSRFVQCQSNLRQIAMAFLMYANDNKSIGPTSPIVNDINSDWMILLGPYLKFPAGLDTNWNNPNTWPVDRVKVLQCPSTYPVVNMWGTSCYGSNDFFTVRRDYAEFKISAFGWWLDRPIDAPVKLSDPRINSSYTDGVTGNPAYFVLAGESTHPSQLLPWWNAMNPYTHYHLGLRNYAFIDGHVEGSKVYGQLHAIRIHNDGRVIRARNNHSGTPPYEF